MQTQTIWFCWWPVVLKIYTTRSSNAVQQLLSGEISESGSSPNRMSNLYWSWCKRLKTVVSFNWCFKSLWKVSYARHMLFSLLLWQHQTLEKGWGRAENIPHAKQSGQRVCSKVFRIPDVWCQPPVLGRIFPAVSWCLSTRLHPSVHPARHHVKDKGPSLTESQLVKQLCLSSVQGNEKRMAVYQRHQSQIVPSRFTTSNFHHSVSEETF